MADALSRIPLWGWVVTVAALGYAAGQLHSVLLMRFSRPPHYCSRCTYYLGWRDQMVSELKKRPSTAKPEDLWERENPR